MISELKKIVTNIRTNDTENSVSSWLILDKLSDTIILEKKKGVRRKFLIKMRDLMAEKSNKNGHIQYFVAESKERPFIGCEDKIVFDKKNQESDDI